MKAFIQLVAFVLVFIVATSGRLYSKDTYVKGYTRKDGTYVAPHYRSAPNSTKADNWSTVGNVNPYTGAPGTNPVPAFDPNKPFEIVDAGVPTSPPFDPDAYLAATSAQTPLATGNSFTANAVALQVLDSRLAQIERRLAALEARPSNTKEVASLKSEAASTAYSKSPIDRLSAWRAVRSGTPQHTVRALLGEPSRVVISSDLETWYYRETNFVYVCFRDGKAVMWQSPSE
jgi:hypothetical protein